MCVSLHRELDLGVFGSEGVRYLCVQAPVCLLRIPSLLETVKSRRGVSREKPMVGPAALQWPWARCLLGMLGSWVSPGFILQ